LKEKFCKLFISILSNDEEMNEIFKQLEDVSYFFSSENCLYIEEDERFILIVKTNHYEH